MDKRSRQSSQRVGVFVDTQNLFYAAKYTYHARVNFGKILEDVVGDRRLVRAIAYGIKSEEGEEQTFFDALEKQGFDVKVKPLQIFYGGAKKGDWDIGIAMDIMRLVGKLDVVILMSGDGDFVDLMEHSKSLGCRTEAAAFGSSSSHKLIEVVDDFYDLDGEDKYLMQKGKVRVQASRQPLSPRARAAVKRSEKPKDATVPIELKTSEKMEATKSASEGRVTVSDGKVVEELEPGVEIIRKVAKPVAKKRASARRKPAAKKRPSKRASSK